MRALTGTTIFLFVLRGCSAQYSSNTSNVSTGSKLSNQSNNPLLIIVGVCVIAVVAAFLLICGTTAWANIRQRTRNGEPGFAPQQSRPRRLAETSAQPLRPEPFIPIVVVSPNNEVEIGRRISDVDRSSLQSPFGQQSQNLQSAPSLGRGRTLPLWLETVLQRQRSTASVESVEMQKGDTSTSGRSLPLRRNSSRARSLRQLGSDILGLPGRDSSANTAPDGQDTSSPRASTRMQAERQEEESRKGTGEGHFGRQ